MSVSSSESEPDAGGGSPSSQPENWPGGGLSPERANAPGRGLSPERADSPGRSSPSKRARRLKRFMGLGLGPILLLAALGWAEIRTSKVQSWWFSGHAREATYHVEPGAAPEVRLPGPGPYDQRLGYTGLDSLVARARAAGFTVTSQARLSDGFVSLLDRGAFAIYEEKDQAGLVLLDRQERPFLEALYPRRVYRTFDSVPALVWDALLFIENRELLDPRHPTRNPAVEWDRLARSVGEMALRKLGSDRSVSGASTLATQIEKYRHSPEGRTATAGEKYRQMISASLRAYREGPDTRERRRQILTEYLNSVPLSAAPGYGEVVGISDGLWAWFGTDFDEANSLLAEASGSPAREPDASPGDVAEGDAAEGPVGDGARSGPPEADPAEGVDPRRRGEVYRQVLSLLLAQRRPSYYLASGSGRQALATLTDQYLRRMRSEGVIDEELAGAALQARSDPLLQAPPLPPVPFVERKAQNQIRSSLLSLLGVGQLYELDRYDLSVETTIDWRSQTAATEALARAKDSAFVQRSGLAAPRLLDRGDPSRVIYSLTLSERTPEGNLIRIQTDNFNGPFNVNEGSRIELGSTAKLRTLVTYLEIVESLHEEMSGRSADELRGLLISPRDPLAQWAVEYLVAHPEAGRIDMLRASMERRYSASPRERFVTGGGTQTFVNFDATYDNQTLTVAEGLENSVNLVWVRVMRDIVAHIMYGPSNATSRILEDVNDPARRAYLVRFADAEGGLFVERFLRKYLSLPPDSILSELVTGRRLSPVRMAWAFRTVAPEASLEDFTDFLETHAVNARLTEGSAADLYSRTSPEAQSLADLGFLASVHPLELWVAGYLRQHPGAASSEVLDASRPYRQEVYGWLFRTSRRNAQDVRIRSLLEVEAFSEILHRWKRVGYPFDNLVPSIGTAIGSSGDRPAALAELVGILVNDGVRLPTFRVEALHFASGTPWEVNLARVPSSGERVLSADVARVAREALLRVVETGTGRRIYGALTDSTGAPMPIGGKTGTGDNRFRVFAPGGRMVESRPVNRTSTFVFFLGDRYFGVITAYVPGPEAGDFAFTSSLPLEILRRMLPELGLFEGE